MSPNPFRATEGSMLPQEIYPTFSAKVGSTALSAPSGSILSLISPENSSREILASFSASQKLDPENTADIAKEALRITKDALNHPDLQSLVPERGPSVNNKNNNQSTPPQSPQTTSGLRLNKFVRRLHDMLQAQKDSGIVEWRRGLLVLHSTNAFAKLILPKYFNTRNFKTFRRQLNYYGFVHVRSFSTTGSTTTALWVNQDLAENGSDDIASVLKLKRVEPPEAAKTAEGRRVRKELAIHTVEEDIGVNAKSLQMAQIRSIAFQSNLSNDGAVSTTFLPLVPAEVHCLPRRSVSSESSKDEKESVEAEPSDSTSAANLLLFLSKSGKSLP